MKSLLKFKSLFMIALLALFFVACDEDVDDDDNDMERFEVWVDSTANNVEAATEETWADTKARYNEWTAEMEQDMADWDEETRTRYENTKKKFDDLERRNTERWEADDMEDDADVTLDQAGMDSWSTKLIGMTDYNSLNNTNLLATYQKFMDNVRANHKNYTDADWDYVDWVQKKLDEADDRITLSTEDEARMVAWETEYYGLKTKESIKDAAKSAVD